MGDGGLPGVRALLFPRSLVVVGASPRRAEIVESVLRSGIPAWGVNANRSDVLGLQCFPRVTDLPELPETALLLVNHERVEQAFEDAARAGVRAFVVPGLGSEAGAEARPLSDRLATRARAIGASVLGPNCMGVASPTGASAWLGTVPETVAPGHVSAISQSGSIGEALLGLGGRVGFRCVVSSGGEAVTDTADLVSFLAGDPGTRVLALFLETVRRPPAFADALARCAAAEKPVVCLKVGRSPAAARAVLAHTGALVGSDRAFSALLRRYGVIQVDDFTELVEALEVLGCARRPKGARVAAISESGGEGALLADRGAAAGLAFEPLPEGLARELAAEFPNYLTPGNPLDAWAIDAVERVYPRSLELLAASGAFDILLAQVDLSQFRGDAEQQWIETIVRALADAAAGRAVFPAVTSVHSADPPRRIQALARELDLPLLRGAGAAMRALARVASWRCARVDERKRSQPIGLDGLVDAEGPLPEHESALVLERHGVRFASRRRAATPAEAARAAAELGFPVVVKLDGPAHKSRVGGVVLGVDTAEAAADAARRLGGSVLVARQVPPGPEAFCGMTRDPQYGPILAVGAGGTAVESLDRIAVSVPPIDAETAAELGAAAGVGFARDDIAQVLVALGRIALDHPEIAEIDVNPLILSDDGAVAVDAFVVVDRAGTA
ncbi:MAG: acetate--CoA ligase family protein [Gaiellaceae bacterium]